MKRQRDEPNVVAMFQRASRDVLQAEFLCESPTPVFGRSTDDMIASISFVTNAVVGDPLLSQVSLLYTGTAVRDS